MKIAVEGCCHDELDAIYDTIEHIQKRKGIKVDLLLICGDFQAVRNPSDLLCMAIPAKYREMKYFYKYYKKEKTAPFLTIVIGGNHEASNYMQELPYGGWLAPNIYYMGYAGIVNVGGVRIGGMSGISKPKDYRKGHFERPPYTNDTLRSAYHVRSLEVFRMKQVREPVDIMMSHDWPRGVIHAGRIEEVLRRKPDFRDEFVNDEFSSVPAQEVLCHIQPRYWFSAHIHVKYSAFVQHKNSQRENKQTKFLALDKCLPGRHFLQILDIEHKAGPPFKISLDAEWLCILKSTNHLLNVTQNQQFMPGPGCSERYEFHVTEKEKESLRSDFGNDLSLPENFVQTVEPYDGTSSIHAAEQPKCMMNPQTTLLCQMLDITDPNAVFCGALTDPSEIDVSGIASDEEHPDTNSSSGGEGEPETEEFPTFLHTMSMDKGALESTFGDESEISSCDRKLQNQPGGDGVPDSGYEIHSLGSDIDCASEPNSASSGAKDPKGDGKTSPKDQERDISRPSKMTLPSPSVASATESNALMGCPAGSDKDKCDFTDQCLDSSGPQLMSSLDKKRTSIEMTEAECPQADEACNHGKRFRRRNVAMYSILANQAGTGADDCSDG